MIQIDQNLKPADLQSELKGFWRLSGEKILLLDKHYDEQQGAPVFTVQGRYTTRGWTEWTQGFQFGSQILQYEACGEQVYLEMGRTNTIEKMAAHVSHTGVHDHGFNNISTYGNLLRLMKAAKIPFNAQEKNFYELALKVSGTVQASRWTKIPGGGFIYSFNGPHSLFVDTIRSCRVLMLSHLLGQALPAENDRYFSLLERAAQHLTATATYNIFYGEGRDIYDVRGMNVFLMLLTGISAVRMRSRVSADFPHGPAVWPGPYWVLPKSWKCSTACKIKIWIFPEV